MPPCLNSVLNTVASAAARGKVSTDSDDGLATDRRDLRRYRVGLQPPNERPDVVDGQVEVQVAFRVWDRAQYRERIHPVPNVEGLPVA